jgi:hypothetical protein
MLRVPDFYWMWDTIAVGIEGAEALLCEQYAKHESREVRVQG